ncbi:MAG TPA: DUF4142 domain-containing protein [Gemmatimonadales bacterium]|nr:DUF4142 domain-containing protein [Gemmatimonadales bacterium]
MLSINRILLSSGIVAAAALAACEPADDRDEFAMDSSMMLDTTAPAAAPMPVETRGYETDAQILTFLKTSNAFAIEDAEIATERATTDAVREFAETVHDDHESLRENLSEVEGNVQATVDELGESDELVSFHRDGVESLRAVEGADFDQAWLEHQIEMTERSLNGVEAALAANPTDELRQALTEAQTDLREHLEKAQQLRTELTNTAT